MQSKLQRETGITKTTRTRAGIRTSTHTKRWKRGKHAPCSSFSTIINSSSSTRNNNNKNHNDCDRKMVASTSYCSVACGTHLHTRTSTTSLITLCYARGPVALFSASVRVYVRSVWCSCVYVSFALSFYRHQFNMKWIGLGCFFFFFLDGRSVGCPICTCDDISPFLMCLLFLFTVPISSTHCFHSCSIFFTRTFVPLLCECECSLFWSSRNFTIELSKIIKKTYMRFIFGVNSNKR